MGAEQAYNATLCWSCRNAVPSPATGAGCPWSTAGKPVAGWTAERRDVYMQRGQGQKEGVASYLVTACPLYQRETRAPHSGYGAGHTKGGKSVRTTKWDTVKARDMLNQGKSIQEIAEAVGVTPSAVGCYFRRIQADEQRLERALAEAQGERVKSTKAIKVEAAKQEAKALRVLVREIEQSATEIIADAPEEKATEAPPLTVRDVAEQLATLDSFYPGASLERGTGGRHFFGMEVYMLLRAGQDKPDVTVRLL